MGAAMPVLLQKLPEGQRTGLEAALRKYGQ
jgi:hypothetical protein